MSFRASLALRSPVSKSSGKIPDLVQILGSNPRGFIFKSSLLCPFANLALEDYIFRHSPPGSRALLFYRNNKSIVIGRNQNPWLELNLQKLQDLAKSQGDLVHLLRRRSGGGTVYHDRGNVNWSFICDLPEFTRDKYAKLIVQSLQKIGIHQSKVNDRHDIVLDTKPLDGKDVASKKISGSAYKISRQRALHHGTALLNSNLQNISELLNSPARSLISARGTESVRSPVANLKIHNRAFEAAVEEQFRNLYDLNSEEFPTTLLGQECLEIKDIRTGYEELRSDEWIYSQTPRFEFSYGTPQLGKVEIHIKNGAVVQFKWVTPSGNIILGIEDLHSGEPVYLHEISDWKESLKKLDSIPSQDIHLVSEMASALNRLLPGISFRTLSQDWP